MSNDSIDKTIVDRSVTRHLTQRSPLSASKSEYLGLNRIPLQDAASTRAQRQNQAGHPLESGPARFNVGSAQGFKQRQEFLRQFVAWIQVDHRPREFM